MQTIYRILDANLNRASEGLRTLEEFARFVLEDFELTSEIKKIRHDLGTAAGLLNHQCLLNARDTGGDVGTSNKTDSEFHRPTIASVVAAATQRVSQALRCLEEYGKVVHQRFAEHIEQIRYRSYDLLAKVDLAAIASNPKNSDQAISDHRQQLCESAKLYLLVDCQQPIDDFAITLRELSDAGVDWFQIRDKQADSRQIVLYGRVAIDALKDRQSKILINDRVDIAVAVGAAGVHLGQEDMHIHDARKITPKEMLIGVSTHSIDQAIEAEKQGADYIGCGPTFPSTTKSFESYKGVDWLESVARQISIPAFAIGGVNTSNIELVTETGLRRVAVSGGIWNSKVPANSARQIREKL